MNDERYYEGRGASLWDLQARLRGGEPSPSDRSDPEAGVWLRPVFVPESAAIPAAAPVAEERVRALIARIERLENELSGVMHRIELARRPELHVVPVPIPEAAPEPDPEAAPEPATEPAPDAASAPVPRSEARVSSRAHDPRASGAFADMFGDLQKIVAYRLNQGHTPA